MKLFYSPGACSMSPHIALTEAGAAFEPRRVAIAHGDHKKPEFLKINAQARVPALEVDGTVLTENLNILLFIASRFPEAKLLPPAGSVEFGRCIGRMSWIATNVHIAFAQIWRQERFVADERDYGPVAAHGRRLVERYFAEIDAHFGAGPKWYLGDVYSIVDINLLPFYRFGNRIGLSMTEQYPNWSRWVDRMLARPAVSKVLAEEGVAMTDRMPA